MKPCHKMCRTVLQCHKIIMTVQSWADWFDIISSYFSTNCEIQKSASINIIVTIVFFLICWTPYQYSLGQKVIKPQLLVSFNCSANCRDDITGDLSPRILLSTFNKYQEKMQIGKMEFRSLLWFTWIQPWIRFFIVCSQIISAKGFKRILNANNRNH